ncbi:16506_t:CDS:10 [Entrophospora sp. SA101]|nr:16506_t:CDS:10 [Entrophospora sp. SA101]CAJ0865564.1 18086_t:CDS:10 [Entrophospora sp. SA101]
MNILLEKWKKGKGSLISFDTKVGKIDDLYVDFDNSWMLTGSSDRGIVARCNPKTGKVNKDLISTSGNIVRPISALLVDRNQILWGYETGEIGITFMNRNASERYYKKLYDYGSRSGCVTSLARDRKYDNIVVSGSSDGVVKLWDTGKLMCTKNFRTSSNFEDNSKVTIIKWNARKCLIAGTENGLIHIWWFDATGLFQKNNNNNSQTEIPHMIINDNFDESNEILSIHYHEQMEFIIVTYKNSYEIKKYDLKTLKCITIFKQGHFANITCTTVDLHDESPNDKDVVRDDSGNHNCNDIIEKTLVSSKNLLASGDSVGTVCLWDVGLRNRKDKDDGNNNNNDSNQECLFTKPLRIFNNNLLSPITSLHIDAFKLLVGSSDGSVSVWEPLTSCLIRTLNQNYKRLPNRYQTRLLDGELAVNCIYSKDYQIVFSTGSTINSWDFTSATGSTNQIKQKKKSTSITTPKYLSRIELQNDVKESKKLIEQERIEKEKSILFLNKFSPLLDLTDDELLDYAMIISKDESNNNQKIDECEEDKGIREAILRSLEISGDADADTDECEDKGIREAILRSLEISGDADADADECEDKGIREAILRSLEISGDADAGDTSDIKKM